MKRTSLLTLAFLVVISCPCRGRSALSNEAGRKPVFTVLVYDYGEVSDKTINQAETEATHIFRKAGVEAIWLNCPHSAAETGKPTVCQRPLGPLDFVLRVIRASKTAQPTLDHCALGFTPLEGRKGAFVTVLYDCITELAVDRDTPPAQLLGHAVAHEIGHLFLGAKHSPRGLMRPRWDEKDVQLAVQRNLLFSRQQAELIRARVLARMSQVDPSGIHTAAAATSP